MWFLHRGNDRSGERMLESVHVFHENDHHDYDRVSMNQSAHEDGRSLHGHVSANGRNQNGHGYLSDHGYNHVSSSNDHRDLSDDVRHDRRIRCNSRFLLHHDRCIRLLAHENVRSSRAHGCAHDAFLFCRNTSYMQQPLQKVILEPPSPRARSYQEILYA